MSNAITEAIRGPMMGLFADRRELRRQARRLRGLLNPKQLEAIKVVKEMLATIDHADEMVRELYAGLPDAIRPEEEERELNTAEPQAARPLERAGQRPKVTVPRAVRWPTLTRERILGLAGEYYERHGKWPTRNSGKISSDGADTWSGFEQCLSKGRRGLPGGSSLRAFLVEEGLVPPAEIKADFNADQILVWSDAYYARTQTWPNTASGSIPESPGDTWERLDKALRRGQRGLEGGTSLSRLLKEQRGVPILLDREPLTIEQILRWVDSYFDRFGEWPTGSSGEVIDAPGETWSAIDASLIQGHRGLPKGSSLPLLLAEHRGKRHVKLLPDFDLARINVWVLNHYTRTGRLPRVADGPIAEAPDESWSIIDNAFRYGRRGLANSGYGTLKAFLDSFFSRDDFGQRVLLKPRLYINTILKWADAYHARTGKWPNINSGDVPEAPGETWRKINHDMSRGCRGIHPKTSLARVLEQRRGLPPKRREPLTFEKILKWADEHRARTGDWPDPTDRSEIRGAPHETWYHISCSLLQGQRGLPNASSIPMLLHTYRGRPHRKMMPPLFLDNIEEWVRSHFDRHHQWPAVHRNREVDDAPDETWMAIDAAFKASSRGLAGCGYRSLDDFMVKKMGKPLSVHRGHWKSERTASISV